MPRTESWATKPIDQMSEWELDQALAQQERERQRALEASIREDEEEARLDRDYGPSALDYAEDVAKSGARGVLKGAASAVEGLNALAETYLPDIRYSTDVGLEFLAPGEKSKSQANTITENFSEGARAIAGDIGAPETAVGGIAESIAQYAVAFVPTNVGLKGLQVVTTGAAATATRWAAAGMAADFLAFDAQEERLSNIVQSVPGLANPVTEFLAAGEDDSEVLGRAKNMVEGAIIGEILGLGGKVVAGTVKRVVDTFADTLKAHKAAKAAKVAVKEHGEDALRVMREDVEVASTATETAVRNVEPPAPGAKVAYQDDLYTVFDEGDGMGRVEFRYGDGHLTFRVNGDTVEIDKAFIEDAFRGRGIMGASAYSRLAKWADERGLKLASDGSLSPEAQRVWSRLEQAGYQIERNPEARLEWDGPEQFADSPDPAKANIVTPDGSPVYTIVDASQGKVLEATLTGLESTFKGVGVDNVTSYGAVRLAQAARQGGADAAERFLERLTQQGVEGLRASDSSALEAARMRLDHTTVTDEATALRMAQGLVDEFQQVLDVLPEGKRVEWTRTIQSAAEFRDGFNPDAMARSFLSQTLGNDGLAAQQLAMRTMLGDVLNQIVDLSKKIASGAAADTDKVLRQQLVERFGLYHSMWQQGRREIARAMNAMKITAELTGADMSVLREAGLDSPALDSLFKDINVRDPQAIRSAVPKVEKVLSGRWKDHAQTIMYGSLLSSPLTHVRNISGNLFNGIMGMIDNFAAIPFGRMRARAAEAAGVEYLQPTARDALAYIVGYWSGLKSSMYVPLRELASAIKTEGREFSLKGWADEMEQNDLLGATWRALKNGVSETDKLSKLDGAHRVETTGYGFYAKEFDNLPEWVNDSNAFAKAALRGLYKAAGTIVGTSSQVGRLLAAGDEMFSTALREGVTRQELVRRATAEYMADMAARADVVASQGKEWADKFYPKTSLDDYVHDSYVRFTLEGNKEIEDAAFEAARYGTFRNDTALTRPLQQLSNVGRDIPGMPVPPLKLIVSFVRTPVSMLSQVYFDRMLGGLIVPLKGAGKGIRAVASEVASKGFNGEALEAAKMRFLNEIAAGGNKADMAAARALVGGSLVAGTMMLAANGRITGGSPRGKDSKEGTGPEPYSIKVGDGYFTFNQTDPFGWIMSASTDIYFAIQRATEADDLDTVERLQEAGAALLMSTVNSLYSKSFFSGVAQFLDALDGEDEGKLVRWFQRVPSMFVPAGGALRYAENLIDPVRSDAQGVIDQILSGLPGLSAKVPVRRDFLGREVKDVDPQVILPTKQSTESDDPLDRELYRLGMSLTMPSRKFNGLVELDAKQYNDYLRYRGQEVRIGGKTLEEALRAIVTSDWYARTRAAAAVDPAKQAALEDVIKDEISRYTEFANDDIRIGKKGIPSSLADVGAVVKVEKAKRARTLQLVPAE